MFLDKMKTNLPFTRDFEILRKKGLKKTPKCTIIIYVYIIVHKFYEGGTSENLAGEKTAFRGVRNVKIDRLPRMK